MEGPKHLDGCEHGHACFKGSVYSDTSYVRGWVDVYVYMDPRIGPEACFRYGSESYEYIAPGPLKELRERMAETEKRDGKPHGYAVFLNLIDEKE